MSVLTIILFVAGIILLISGAELLVRGASRLAVSLGISPLVVGLTVVAFGTSSPELAVSIQSAVAGTSDITIGNVIGSNIFNVLFILGISALITPLLVSQQLVRLDVPLMILVSVVLLLMALDGTIGRIEAALLFASGLAYTVILVRISRREAENVKQQYDEAYGPERPTEKQAWPLQILLIVIGLALLVIGSRWLIDGAVAIASALGVSELIIGLTIIAIGTSLPEVATSVVAGLRGERDIAVGNVVGSCLFNIFVVLGFAGMVSPSPITVAPAAINLDIPVMVASAALCLPIFFRHYRIGRWEGALFLSYYIIYTMYLILAAAQHDALRAFSRLVFLVVPITIATIAFVMVREFIRRGSVRRNSS